MIEQPVDEFGGLDENRLGSLVERMGPVSVVCGLR
jgi:hypothetical protein